VPPSLKLNFLSWFVGSESPIEKRYRSKVYSSVSFVNVVRLVLKLNGIYVIETKKLPDYQEAFLYSISNFYSNNLCIVGREANGFEGCMQLRGYQEDKYVNLRLFLHLLSLSPIGMYVLRVRFHP
jgi:hypothetical protein